MRTDKDMVTDKEHNRTQLRTFVSATPFQLLIALSARSCFKLIKQVVNRFMNYALHFVAS